jgi:hypothetical protein
MLAEATSNIATRSVTPISSGVSTDFEELEEDARRYIWVPSRPDAFKTNGGEGVVEFSDVVELDGARTSEAMRSPPESSSLGLYGFRYNQQGRCLIRTLRTMMSMRPGAPSRPLARFPKVNCSCVAERFATRGTTYEWPNSPAMNTDR